MHTGPMSDDIINLYRIVGPNAIPFLCQFAECESISFYLKENESLEFDDLICEHCGVIQEREDYDTFDRYKLNTESMPENLNELGYFKLF